MSQEVRKALKKIKVNLDHVITKHKKSNKSKKYLMIILGYLKDQKESVIEKFKKSISSLFEERLKKIESKNPDRQIFVKELKLEFECFQDAVDIFFKGEIQSAFKLVFGKNKKIELLHQKTILGLNEAIEFFNQEFQCKN